MNETKPWYLSKGVWGGVITIITSLLTYLNVESTPAETTAIITGASGILSIVGRLLAKKQVVAK